MADQNTKIRITAETAQAEAALRSFGTSITGLQGSLTSFAGALGGALSVGAFAGFIKSSIDLQDELGGLSKKTGIAASDLAGFKFAADQNGTSLEMVAKGVKELSIGMATTPDKFAKLGINAKTATGALIQISDLVAGMPDGMQKTALLAELMGKKVGPEMAEFMSIGGAAMREYIAKGKDIYKVTDDNAAAAKAFKDQMGELKARLDGVGISIANKMLPSMNSIIERSLVAQKEYGNLIGLLALVGNTGLSIAGVEIDPQKRAQNEINDIYKERLGLWRDLEIYKKREQNPDYNQEWNRKDLARANEQLKKLEERLQKIKEAAPAITGVKPGKPQGTNQAVDDLLNGEKYAKLNDDIAKRITLLNAEIQSEHRLTETQKFALDIAQQLQEGKLKLSDGQKIALTASLETALALDKENEARKHSVVALAAQADVMQQMTGDFDRQQQAQLRNMEVMSASNRALGEELDKIGKGADTSRRNTVKFYTDGKFNADEYAASMAWITNEETRQIEVVKLRAAQQDKLNSSWEYGAQKAIRSYMDEVANVAKQSENLFSNSFKGMEDALVKFVQTGKLDFKSLADSIIADLIRIQVRQNITGPLAGWMSTLFSGSSIAVDTRIGTGYTGSTATFDGGGFTGAGSRSGGLDGKGGFIAVLHPNETVLDHTKGQRMGGINITSAPVINIDSRTDRAEVQRLVQTAVQQGNAHLVDQLQRQGAI